MKNITMGLSIKTEDPLNLTNVKFIEGTATTLNQDTVNFSFKDSRIDFKKDNLVYIKADALDTASFPDSAFLPELLILNKIKNISFVSLEVNAGSIFKLEEIGSIFFIIKNDDGSTTRINMNPSDIHIARFKNNF